MRKFLIMLSLLVLVMSSLAFTVQPSKAIPTLIIVPDDFPTIQEAINNAATGDTILVRAGIYQESFVVNKTVSLIGENREATKIVNSVGDTVILLADNVILQNFTFCNSTSGAMIVKSSNCLIENNNFIQNRNEAVGLAGFQDTVRNTIVRGNYMMGNNAGAGVLIGSVSNSTIMWNVIVDNAYGVLVSGLAAYEVSGDRNLIAYNHISSNFEYGVYLDAGIHNCVIVGNNITEHVSWAYTHFAWGVCLMGASNNQIMYNRVSDNKIGLFFGRSASNNRIHHNSFINNTAQAYGWSSFPPAGTSMWDNGYPSGGNYWSNYNGTDNFKGFFQNETGSDGIGDIPYVINMTTNNKDNYPRMQPCSPLFTDITFDGKVDMKDVSLAARHFGSIDPLWCWIIDMPPRDNKIDMKDISRIARDFGKE